MSCVWACPQVGEVIENPLILVPILLVGMQDVALRADISEIWLSVKNPSCNNKINTSLQVPTSGFLFANARKHLLLLSPSVCFKSLSKSSFFPSYGPMNNLCLISVFFATSVFCPPFVSTTLR